MCGIAAQFFVARKQCHACAGKPRMVGAAEPQTLLYLDEIWWVCEEEVIQQDDCFKDQRVYNMRYLVVFSAECLGLCAGTSGNLVKFLYILPKIHPSKYELFNVTSARPTSLLFRVQTSCSRPTCHSRASHCWHSAPTRHAGRCTPPPASTPHCTATCSRYAGGLS